MERRFRGAQLSLFCFSMIALVSGSFSTQTASAQTPSSAQGAVVQMDRTQFESHLRARGFQRLGGISKVKSDSSDPRFRSFPHFNSSFTVNGQTFPFTMLGFPPRTGKPSRFRSIIVPLRMKFLGFGPNQDINVTFDPKDAVTNIVNSPMFQEARFPNGFGQFGDMLQRATFWNKMDPEREWHVRMADPVVLAPVDIEVTPETGVLFQVGNTFFGDVLIGFLDSQAQTIMQLKGVDADELPIFVTQNVTAEALGYHNAFSIVNPDATENLQTYIFSSWLDPRLVSSLLADVSTLNHEVGEWLNDPFVNNVVPTWMYPPPTDPRTVCSFNPFLEVGDPQGNGPTFDDFPTVPIVLDGVTYHLQDLVMLPWFADEVPSSAQNGWYDFPATNQIKVPAVYCP
jgi:hypothetical protein